MHVCIESLELFAGKFCRIVGLNNGFDARSTKVTDTHFDLLFADKMVLMATVNGSKAERNMMIHLLADNLSKSGEHEDLYEVFLKTNKDIIKRQGSGQVAEFRSTLRYKLSLGNVFDVNKKPPFWKRTMEFLKLDMLL